MTVRLAAIAMGLALAIAPAARGQHLSPIAAALAEAREAAASAQKSLAARDWQAALVHTRRALTLRPGHPTLLLSRARILARLGHGEEALADLGRLGRMGIGVVLESDEALAPLAAQSGYAAVRARLEANRQPIGSREVAFRLESRDFVPEGLAWDPRTRTFFLASVHRRTIVRVSESGAAAPLVAEGGHGLWSVLGLVVAPASRTLWAASSALEETRGIGREDIGRAGLFAFDVETGAPKGVYLLTDGATAHALGDIALDNDERPFVSDSRTGAIYWLPAGATALTPFVPAGTLASPQGLAFTADGSALLAADYSLGLARIDRSSRAVTLLTAPDDVTLLGIDGLSRWGDRYIAVQNGIAPHRVVSIALGDRGRRVRSAETLQANLEGFDEPTLGLVRGDEYFYVANSHWNRFEKGVLQGAETLEPPLILRVPLRKRSR